MNFLTKTRFLVIVIIIQAVLLVSILATFGYRYYSYRQNRPDYQDSRNEKPQEQRDFMSKALKLSPEQRSELKGLKGKFHQSFDTLELQSRNISKLLTDEVVKEKSNNSRIDSLIERYGEIQRAQKQAMVKHLLEVKSTCNPEQQERFNKFMLKMQDYQQNQYKNRERMRRGQNPRNKNKNNQN